MKKVSVLITACIFFMILFSGSLQAQSCGFSTHKTVNHIMRCLDQPLLAFRSQFTLHPVGVPGV